MVLRKIPFTPMVKKVLPYIDFDRAKNTNLNTISTRMKRLLPERTRTNFGIPLSAVAKSAFKKETTKKNASKQPTQWI